MNISWTKRWTLNKKNRCSSFWRWGSGHWKWWQRRKQRERSLIVVPAWACLEMLLRVGPEFVQFDSHPQQLPGVFGWLAQACAVKTKVCFRWNLSFPVDGARFGTDSPTCHDSSALPGLFQMESNRSKTKHEEFLWPFYLFPKTFCCDSDVSVEELNIRSKEAKNNAQRVLFGQHDFGITKCRPVWRSLSHCVYLVYKLRICPRS